MKKSLLLCLAALFLLTGCRYVVAPMPDYHDLMEFEETASTYEKRTTEDDTSEDNITTAGVVVDGVSEYAGEPFAVVNGNVPDFAEEDYTTEAFEYYSELDKLGRCGVAYANIGMELMPTEERESIGHVKPSGWQLVKYDFVDGKYLYNRCHLIGFQLAGENANERNLITGTRFMNVTGMLPFENQVAEYVKETGNHVLYRVTPRYTGDNLVAEGVEMEALSVEDAGEGIRFRVYVYNHQPGVVIDYATGESRVATEEEVLAVEVSEQEADNTWYVLNINSMKFHYPNCSAVSEMKAKNKLETGMPREMLLIYGFKPCGRCEP